MKCTECGFENPGGFKFCGNCGAKLKNICPSCGFENPPNFKFCGECGNKLFGAKKVEQGQKQHGVQFQEPEKIEKKEIERRDENFEKEEIEEVRRESERRPVSILFADISGFTTLSEKLDPEELRAFIGDVLNKLADIVKRNGGYVDKFIGDEVMALFGAPRAMGDDTERAVRTAWEMMKFVRDNYKDISLHGGIATGDVVVGSISERPQDYTAMGDTVNIAKRLEEESSSWQFLVDENTFLLTSNKFSYKYFGEIKLKGKTKQLKVYELMEQKLSARIFIGREKEFSEVKNILNSGYALIGIYGEPGVGISSFVDFIHSNLPNSYKFIASDYGFFGVIKDMITSVGDNLSDRKEEMISKLSKKYNVSWHFLGYIFGVVFPESPLKYLSPEQIEQETLKTISDFMNSAFKDKIVIIDSFSEADRYTKNFFFKLPSYSPKFSVVVGFDKGTVDLEQFHNGWRFIELSNFSIDEVRRFLGHLSDKVPTDDFTSTIYTVTGGNPLFVSELYALLEASGDLIVENGFIRLKPDFVIPKAIGIRQVILSKVDNIPQSARYVLEVMSCLNIQNKDVLYKFFEDDLRSFAKAIDILKQNALIEEREDFFIFRQMIYKDVIYDKLLKAKRYEIHSKLFECASRISGDDVDIISIAADQAEKSERFQDAFEMYRKAGIIARSKFNLAQAIYFFENARRILDNIKDFSSIPDLYEFFDAFGNILYHVGNFQGAKACFESAEKFSTDKAKMIKAKRCYGDCLQMLGQFDEAEKVYKDIINQTEQDPSLKSEFVKTLALLCHLFVDRGQPGVGEGFGIRALQMSDENFKRNYKEIYSDVVNALGRAYLSMGNIQKARQFFMELYDISLGMDNQRLRGVAMSNYAVSLYMLGELESALLLFKQYLDLSRSIMDTRGTAIAYANLSQVLFEIGDVDEAVRKATESVKIFRDIGDKYGTMETLEMLANMKVLLGDYDQVEKILIEELIPQTDSDIKKSKYNLLIAMAMLGKKKFNEAKLYLDKAKQLNEDILNDPYYNIALSRLEFEKGDFVSAHTIARNAINLSTRDTDKIFSILNFLKIISPRASESVVFQDEKENYEKELKNIISRFRSFSAEAFKFFS